MEVMDLSTRQVWQSRLPVSPEEYEAMTLEPPFTNVGVGCEAMDAHWFRRSPGAAEDGPMDFRDFFPNGDSFQGPATRPGS